MHHKRKRPKNQRAGCLTCKPWKANHAPGDLMPMQERRIGERGGTASHAPRRRGFLGKCALQVMERAEKAGKGLMESYDAMRAFERRMGRRD